MADVRIIDLPSGAPTAAHKMPIDLSETQSATISDIGDAARPFASQAEAEAGTSNTKTMTPLTSAQQLAALGPTLFATTSEGALAATALQPDDVAALAFKDKAGIEDIDATGSPSSTTFLAGNGSWVFLPGGGNMLSSVYDPDSVGEEVAFRSSAVFRVGTYAAAPSSLIPDTIDRVVVSDRAAYFAAIDDDHYNSLPDVLRFENDGRKFGISEPVVVPSMAGAVGDGIADDTAALQAFFTYSAMGTLTSGKGVSVKPESGRYRITETVTIPYGAAIQAPEGSSLYGFQIVLDPGWTGGDAGVLIQAETEAFTTAFGVGLAVNCNGLSGVEGIRFEGAYFNSTLRNIYVYNVGLDVPGLHVKPLDRAGAQQVCESLLLENVYVVRMVSASDATAPAILLDRCQETTLINVKGFGYNPASAGASTAAAIKFLDSRGITMLGGAAAFAGSGVEIEAATRQVVGITMVGVTYERLTDNRLYIHGTSTWGVANVRDENVRIETPAATLGLNASYASFLDIETLYQNYQLGLGVSSAIIRGYGTGTVDATARYARLTAPNSNMTAYGIRPSVLLTAASTPQIGFGADGRLVGGTQASWKFRWSATSSVDNGYLFTSPNGAGPLQLGETPVTFAPRIGFLGKSHIERPTLAAAATDAATTQTLVNSIRTALINLGLGG